MRNHFLWCGSEMKAGFKWVSSLLNTVPLLAQLEETGQQWTLLMH